MLPGMNRREFSFALAGVTASSFLPASAFAFQDPETPTFSADASTVYKRSLVIDLNSAPALSETMPLPPDKLKMARGCGVSVVKMSLGGFNMNFHDTVDEIAFMQKLIETHPDYFLQVRTVTDVKRAQAENKMGIIFSFEGVEALDAKVENIAIFRNLGVRIMQLSYNLKSPFGAGVLAPDAGGLTPLGREAVKKMNELKVAIDLSHANPQTTSDALALSNAPMFITHAGCAAVHAHPRNKTDEQIRALANKGGVMGIYTLPYLTASPKQPTVDDFMAHVTHALKVGGEDHVGIGTDGPISPFNTSPEALAEFKKAQEARVKSGVAAPGEDRPIYVIGMNTPLRLQVVADQLLKAGYSTRVTEKVLGGNTLRLLNEVW
jgi:membrane dipeptidase